MPLLIWIAFFFTSFVSAQAPRFASDLFKGEFKGKHLHSVSSDYVIRSGDEIRAYFWEAENKERVYLVDPQGYISIEELGPVKIAGIANKELVTFLEKKLSAVYKNPSQVYAYIQTSPIIALYVSGQVHKPGLYEGYPSDSILTFLDQAGGLTQNGGYRKVSVLREQQMILTVDLYDFIQRGQLEQHLFRDGDIIFVPPHEGEILIQKEGQEIFFWQLKDEFIRGQELLSLVKNEGPLTGVSLQRQKKNFITSQTFSREEFCDQCFREGDTINFFNHPMNKKFLIHIDSQSTPVKSLSVSSHLYLRDVLDHLEIDPKVADYEAIYLKRHSAKLKQQKALEESLQRLEKNALLALSESQGESAIRAKEAEMTRTFIESVKKAEPEGILALDSQYDIYIEQGDTIVIPSRTSTVDIIGEVLYPQTLIFQEGMTINDCLKKTGGLTFKAYEQSFIVIHQNQTITISNSEQKLKKGDKVIILPKVDSKDRQVFADITQIIYQIAVTTKVALGL